MSSRAGVARLLLLLLLLERTDASRPFRENAATRMWCRYYNKHVVLFWSSRVERNRCSSWEEKGPLEVRRKPTKRRPPTN